MRVLVTGGSGGLGRYVCRELARVVEVLAPPRMALDVTDDAAKVIDFVVKARPDVVVHLAALTDTALCEREPDRAMQINGLGTVNVVQACIAAGARLVYMSTDAVFSFEGPHREDGWPSPRSVYGFSKYAGEQTARALGDRALVVRANFFTRHCNGKTSFAAYVIREASAGRVFGCYTDTISTPVFAGTLARRIAEAVAGEWSGVLHVASADAIDRAEQARLICVAYGLPRRIAETKGAAKYDGRLDAVRGRCSTVRKEIEEMVREEPLQ